MGISAMGISGYQEYQEDQDQISGATYISDVVFLAVHQMLGCHNNIHVALYGMYLHQYSLFSDVLPGKCGLDLEEDVFQFSNKISKNVCIFK